MNVFPKYTRIAIFLHWSVALLILLNLVLVWVVDAAPDDQQRLIIDTHKSIGISVLGLVLLRMLWRVGHPPPPLPASYARWEQRAAHWGHLVFYGMMLALPLTGWMHDSAWKDAASHPMTLFGTLPWPRIVWISDVEPVAKARLHDLFGSAHTLLSYVLYVLLATHIAAALKHQFLDHERELQRMLP